jgi:hypothetical protein
MQQSPVAPRAIKQTWTAEKQGTTNKSRGKDEICHELYAAYWETLTIVIVR